MSAGCMESSLARNSATSSPWTGRSEEHTSELQSLAYLVCRLLLEKKKKPQADQHRSTGRNRGGHPVHVAVVQFGYVGIPHLTFCGSSSATPSGTDRSLHGSMLPACR